MTKIFLAGLLRGASSCLLRLASALQPDTRPAEGFWLKHVRSLPPVQLRPVTTADPAAYAHCVTCTCHTCLDPYRTRY